MFARTSLFSLFLFQSLTLFSAPPSPILEELREFDIDPFKPNIEKINFIPSIQRPIGAPPPKVEVKPGPKITHTENTENQEFVVNLKDPVFSQGVIKTDQGGVITGENVRIQAQHIEYTNRIENGQLVKKVVAEGDLLMEYGGQAFVGNKLEFDFVKKTGVLWDGKTYVDAWFLGGEKIELQEDGSYFIYNAYITTCESQQKSWDINAGAVKITKEHLLAAHNISFRFLKVPIFWLPSFKFNLKMFKDPPVSYKVRWDKGLGPRFSMRYRIFSWEHFNLSFRFDYRITKGPGIALESDYYSADERTVFLTKSYGAYDKSVPDETGPRRYRLQGLFDTKTVNNNTQLHIQYDKMSDDKMPGDFKGDSFEIDTQKRTYLLLTHNGEDIYGALNFQPRINNFQSINQELPYATGGHRPWTLGSSGIITENSLSAGYLDYIFSRSLNDILRSEHGGRFEMRNQLYRPFPLRYLTITPNIGFIGIAYTNSPNHDATYQAIGNYGLQANSRIIGSLFSHKHLIEPYFSFQGYSPPTSPNVNHFTFNIDDGYVTLNLARIGVRNALYTKRQVFLPEITADLYTYAYLSKTKFHRGIPKSYFDAGWHLPSISIFSGFAWNMQEHVLDYSNIRTEWTVNEYLALAVEFRHRSRFDWRKADHESFFLDAAHTIEKLAHSPLSDGRNTLLTRIFLRISPIWSVQFQSHHGWGRKNEPRYNESKVDLYTQVSCSWRVRVSYEHMPNDDRLTGAISLIK